MPGQDSLDNAPVGAEALLIGLCDGSRIRADPGARAPCRCHDDRVRITLLIVDDHAGFRAFARALLEAAGYDVVGEADNGASALAAVAALDPDLVLLDVALPDQDGFEVCARLSHRDAARPAVVLISSRDASSFRQRLAASSARGFLPKSDLSGPALAALSS